MNEETDKQADAEAYQQGLALLRADKVAEGIEVLRRISARVPKVLGDIAWAYRMKGDNDAAFACLEDYVRHFPDDPGGWALMARIERDRDMLASALRFARRAIEANPNDAELWFDLGEILFHLRDWKGAARAYRKCLKINPAKTRASVCRQIALRSLAGGRYRKIVRWPVVRWFLRRLFSSGLMGDLIEADMGIVAHDRRWQTPLEWAGAAPFAEAVPAGQEPDRFAVHFAQCRCPFWQWFRELRDAGKMPPPPNGEVRRALELGGGPGHVAHHFALAGFAIQSFTPDESARHDREQRRIATTVGDFHLVQARGGTFDLLVADHALQRCRAPLPALWEWKRLLRTDGYLIVMARLALNRPAPHPALQEPAEADVVHLGYLAYGIAGHVTTLSYWQLRWLFRQVGFQLIVETLEDPMTGSLESVEHVDGRRPADPTRAWNAFFLLRRPGRLPYDGALEKPRPIVR